MAGKRFVITRANYRSRAGWQYGIPTGDHSVGLARLPSLSSMPAGQLQSLLLGMTVFLTAKLNNMISYQRSIRHVLSYAQTPGWGAQPKALKKRLHSAGNWSFYARLLDSLSLPRHGESQVNLVQ